MAAGARAEEPAPDEWQFTSTTYVWATSLNGDVAVKGQSSDVDASFHDILKESDSIIAFEGRLGVQKGDWGAYIDGIYNRIGAKADAGGQIVSLDVDATMELVILEAAVFYQVGAWPLSLGASGAETAPPRLTLQTYAGARYTSLDVDLDLELKALGQKRHAQADGSEEWVDPIVGSRVILDFAERWQILVGGDVGGFGVGSEFTWSALGVLGYGFELFGHPSHAVAGYRALYQDYEDGNGSNQFKWDMTIHGPIIGLVTRF